MAMTTTYTTFAGALVHESRGGTERFYSPDPLGSTSALLDASGAVTDAVSYWPYGEARSRTGTTPTKFLFVGTLGYFADALTRLYVRARHYLATTVRWMTVDPLWPDQVAYLYVEGRPLTFVDPTGTHSIPIPFPIPAPPPGISMEVWRSVAEYLVSLGLGAAEVLAGLTALAVLATLVGVSCSEFKKRRYQVCPHPGGNPSGMRTCKEGDGCMGTVALAKLWAECAAIQAFLTAVCFPNNRSHQAALLSYVRNSMNCSQLIDDNCDPIRCARRWLGY